MFNLFFKNQEPEDLTPSEEEMEKQRVFRQELREKWKKENELYGRIVSKDENLVFALKMMVHRIDVATDYSLLSKIGTLESRMEEMFPESND
jgi:hypothetical protein